MKKTTLLAGVLLAMLLSPGHGAGQAVTHCGTDEMYRARVQQHPEMLVQQKQMDAFIESVRTAQAKTSTNDTGQIIIVPMVFHIIHNNGPENIGNQAVIDEVARLNIDYRKLNKDTSLVRPLFKPLVSDAKIEFRLATVNPWGQCTNGIDRVVSGQTANAGDNVKSLSWWDSRQYLNIWVVHDINSSTLPPGELIEGYSNFPWDAVLNPGNDGIVMDYHYIGLNQRVLSHEIGHYFGLYHPFQDSCSLDQRTQGDHIADTPPVATASFGWHPGTNSCHTDTPDLPDMIENYMDYADNHYMFTPDQVWRMRAFAFERNKLVSAENLAYTLSVCSVASGIKNESTVSSCDISVYPNPSSDNITLAVSSNARQGGSISLFDITGKMLYNQPNIVFEGGGQNMNFSRAGLNVQLPGIYILQITIGNSVVEKKLIFQE